MLLIEYLIDFALYFAYLQKLRLTIIDVVWI